MTVPTIALYSGIIPNPNTQSAEDFTVNAVTVTTYQAENLGVDINATVEQFNIEIIDFNDFVVTSQATIDDSVLDAADYASASANSANMSASSASAANYVGEWGVASGAATPASYSHNGGLWLLKVDLVSIELSEPSTTNSDWLLIDGDYTGFVIADGGTLVWKANNEIQADATVTMPLANIVNANAYLDIYVAEKYSGITLTINTSGSDLFDDGTDTDAQLILTIPSGGYYRISSNGISTLRV